MKLDDVYVSLMEVGKFFENYAVRVPPYQRSYSWDPAHVQDLIDDTFSAYKDNAGHFLGTVVTAEVEGRVLEVVDGQQRLATCHMAAVAVRDALSMRRAGPSAKTLENQYIQKVDILTGSTVCTLTLNDRDQEFYAALITGHLPPGHGRPTIESHRRLLDGYRLLAAFVDDLAKRDGIAEAVNWLQYLMGHVKVIRIRVPAHADAFSIFECLNDRGRDLTAADLFKSYLYGHMGAGLSAATVKWKKIIKTLDPIGGERTVMPYAESVWALTQGDRHLTASSGRSGGRGGLYAKVKQVVRTREAAECLLDELLNNVTLFSAMKDSSHVLWSSHGDGIRQRIMTLEQIMPGQASARLLHGPYMMAMAMAVLSVCNTEDIKTYFSFLLCAAMRLIATNDSGSQMVGRARMCAPKLRAGEMTFRAALGELTAGVPADAAFVEGFSRWQPSNNGVGRYALLCLEKHAGSPGLAESFLPDPHQVRRCPVHRIMPNRPARTWQVGADEMVAFSGYLGNLILVDRPINARTDVPFVQLVRMAELSRSSFELTKHVSRLSEWTPEAIVQRQNTLARSAPNVWHLNWRTT